MIRFMGSHIYHHGIIIDDSVSSRATFSASVFAAGGEVCVSSKEPILILYYARVINRLATNSCLILTSCVLLIM